MSRRYSRKQHQNRFWREYWEWYSPFTDNPISEEGTQYLAKKYHLLVSNKGRLIIPWDYLYNFQGTPSWWNKLYHTIPRRRKDKKLCRKLLFKEDLDDYIVHLDKKPHNYYW